jgi:hypothetical protein
MLIFQTFDALYTQLVLKVNGGSAEPFEAAALLLVCVVAIHHFPVSKVGTKKSHSVTASGAATTLFEGWTDREELQTVLNDIILVHDTSKARESAEKIPALDFWIKMMKEALNPQEYESAVTLPGGGDFNRSPVLFGEVQKVGTGTLNGLQPMFLSKERENKFEPMDAGAGDVSVRRRRTSFLTQSSMGNMDQRDRSGSGNSGTGSLPMHSNMLHTFARQASLAQSSSRPAVVNTLQFQPAGGGDRQNGNLETFPISRIKQLQHMDMTHRHSRDATDKRRLLVYIGTDAAGDAGLDGGGGGGGGGESKALVLVFSCEERRSQFWKMCEEAGYVEDTGPALEELYSLEFEKIAFHDVHGKPLTGMECGDAGKRKVLGEGTFATVFEGSRCVCLVLLCLVLLCLALLWVVWSRRGSDLPPAVAAKPETNQANRRVN